MTIVDSLEVMADGVQLFHSQLLGLEKPNWKVRIGPILHNYCILCHVIYNIKELVLKLSSMFYASRGNPCQITQDYKVDKICSESEYL